MPGVAIALGVATFAVYASTVWFGFVTLDDPTYVTRNPHVLQGLTGLGIAWAFTTTWASNYHPLTWLVHMLIVSLFGVAGGAHHAVNVALHAANGVLLFVLLLRMTGATGRSAVVAALFALHPAHVESVAWIAELKDVFSTLFWMLTMLAYERYVRHPERRRLLTLVVLYAAGLLAKPMLVTLPFVLLLLDVWPLRRLSISPFDRLKARALLIEKAPLFVLSALSCVVTFVAQRRGGAVSALDVLPWTSRIVNALLACEAYLRKLIWPSDLAVFYPYPHNVSSAGVAGALLIVVGLTLGVLLLRRTRPCLTVGWLWFLGTLVPVIGLVQVGGQAMADRYTYVPFIGLFMAIVWSVADLVPRTAIARTVLATATGVALAASAVAAHVQVSYWRTSETLWTRALDVTTGNHRAYAALGQILAADGRAAQAIAYYGEAIRLAPAAVQYRNLLGLARSQEGDHAGAMREFQAALQLKADAVDVRANMGLVLSRMGRLDEAAQQYGEALRFEPDFAEGRAGLGRVYAMQRRLDEAVAQYREAVRLRPDYAEAHHELGVALARQGKTAEAIASLTESLRLDPTVELAHFHLAVALVDARRIDEARAQLDIVLRLNPANQDARRALDTLTGR